MDSIKWCTRQKRGIRLIQPSENVCKSYIRKSENSLASMRLNFRAGITEWAVSAAYYARYNVLYALLMKCGVKSEIHECTFAVAKFLFEKEIPASFMDEIETAKAQRVDMQYYTDRLLSKEDVRKNIETAGDFVLALKDVIEKTGPEKIDAARANLRKSIESA